MKPHTDIKVGQQVKVRGFSMKCQHTIEVARVHRIMDEHEYPGGYDCVIMSDGIKIKSDSRTFIRDNYQ